MLSKVIAWGPDRKAALDKLDAALERYTVLGVGTNVEYLRLLINDDDVRAGRLDTDLIDRKMPDLAFRQHRRHRTHGRGPAPFWVSDEPACRSSVPWTRSGAGGWALPRPGG